jgi:hypothetical protein
MVLGSAKFLIERHQIEVRVRLDGPTLADQEVRELLHESDLFSRSFHGGGFGSISPFDFIQIFAHLAEIFSHLLLMLSLTNNVTQFVALICSVVSVALPLFLPRFFTPPDGPDSLYNKEEAHAAQRLEKMRSLAFSEMHRSEVSLFGMGNWIVESWSNAWKVLFNSDIESRTVDLQLLSDANLADFFSAFQNVCAQTL